MLRIRSLQKTFLPGTPNAVAALCSVDLDIEDGCFAGIIGTNGSGKSTLLNAVAGTWQLVYRAAQRFRAALIGRVFQNPFAGTAAEMTIAENLVLAQRRGHPRGLGIALRRGVRAGLRDRVRTLNMGLEDRLDNPIGTLSGGQRQALTLLMATWCRPKLLLLDEHTAALDPKSAAQVAVLTQEIIARERLTALMVTHSMQQAVQLPQRIIMMHRGAVVEDYREERKARVRVADLMHAFDRVRRHDLFDAAVAEVVGPQYA